MTAPEPTLDITLTYDEVEIIYRIITAAWEANLLCTEHEDCASDHSNLVGKIEYIHESMQDVMQDHIRTHGEL